MEVAGQGLTLTRSSNVVFLELDWTPAKHDQAEDRCHRIGQQDAVNAYYLLAADTVDETIATLLERKRAVIEAVTDGREEDEEGVARRARARAAWARPTGTCAPSPEAAQGLSFSSSMILPQFRRPGFDVGELVFEARASALAMLLPSAPRAASASPAQTKRDPVG